MTLVGEPDAGDPHVRFDEREVETEQGGILWHRQPKGPATRMAYLNRRATSRLYRIHQSIRDNAPGCELRLMIDIFPWRDLRGDHYAIRGNRCLEKSSRIDGENLSLDELNAGFLAEDLFQQLYQLTNEIGRLIGGFMRYLESIKTKKSH